jgi:hypothetical protein
MDSLLRLDAAERSVAWRNSQGQRRIHVFQRITQDLWNGYFARMLFETDATSRTIDLNSAALWLYGQAIQRVQGYVMKGDVDLCTLPNWKERIPMGHRLQAVNLLASVSRSVDGPTEIEPDCEIVSLDAAWNLADDGGMQKFVGLLHRFSIPTTEQMMRFSRETSRSLVVGGSRSGKTIHAIRQKVLLSLYDDLIQSVDGYEAGGLPLREGALKIEMDAFHKIAAAGALFSNAGEEEQTPEE